MSDASEHDAPICERCLKNPAVVHVRRVAEGDEGGLHVCEACAAHLGAAPGQEEPKEQPSGDPLASLLRSMGGDEDQVSCPGCGLDSETFKRKGRLGCASCWDTFAVQLDMLLLRLQGRTRHHGRSPQREGEPYERASMIRRLNDELERAVGAEEYERAAQLRDKLRDLIGAGQEGSHE